MKKDRETKAENLTRRNFIKSSASASAGLAALLSGGHVFAAGSDAIRVGLVGCGNRGTGAAQNCVEATENVQIVAMGDLFRDRLDDSRKTLTKKLGKNMAVTDETCFVGFDAYQKVLAADVNLVILATPPSFRPEHLKAAVEKDKNVFMEKPVAVDPAGVRSVIESSDQAKRKGLAIVAGTQRRHAEPYLELMKRIHDGMIGEAVGAQCYWNGGGMLDWGPKDNPEWTDLERQCRRWYFYTWICGDHIVEQHVHNLDVVSWAFGDAVPYKCTGMGGRQFRTGPEYGNIWDHFSVEFEFRNGARILSMCRHSDNCTPRISEKIVGTNGVMLSVEAQLKTHDGRIMYKYPKSEYPNPYVQEHKNLIDGIRANEPLNEGKRIAHSTLWAVMGRMSAYTGREIKWDWVMKESKLDLSPPHLDFKKPLPMRPVAIPGKTELI